MWVVISVFVAMCVVLSGLCYVFVVLCYMFSGMWYMFVVVCVCCSLFVGICAMGVGIRSPFFFVLCSL